MKKKSTILLVDDSKENINILLSLLNKYDVIVALSGEKALKMVQKHKVDIILLDIVMPHMDGYEVCKILKSNEKSKEIPILFITANTDGASIEKAFNVGGNDYISKPFKSVEIIARIKMHLKLSETLDRLEYMAMRDFLTGIYNRRKFFEVGEKVFAQSTQLYAIMIDIDRFKKVNDTYGHPFGDQVIQEVVKVLENIVSDDTILGRMGGEEFAILCRVLSADKLETITEKMRSSVAKLNLNYKDEKVKVTISIGIAQKDSQKYTNDTLDMLLCKADEALYKAKERGRDRVCMNM